MQIYITIGEIQKAIEQYHDEHQVFPDFRLLMQEVCDRKEFHTEPPAIPDIAVLKQLDDASFLREIHGLYYPFSLVELFAEKDYDFVRPTEDVATVTEFWGIKSFIHSHDCFEIDYVFQGECEFTFHSETRILKEGDFCIISPYANHCVRLLTRKSCVFPIMIKEKTFRTTFFALLSNTDILSSFFKWILTNPDEPNYLLFQTNGSYEIRHLVKELFLERFRYDKYVNRCDVYWLNLLFVNILRDYREYSQFSSYESVPDYAPILRYIQTHYHTITLSQLSQKFNYTVPYLSKIIKEITGENFSQVIRRLKLKEAEKLLLETKDSIEKISEQTGYSSADHFSRAFRQYYGIAPQKYRKQHSDI